MDRRKSICEINGYIFGPACTDQAQGMITLACPVNMEKRARNLLPSLQFPVSDLDVLVNNHQYIWRSFRAPDSGELLLCEYSFQRDAVGRNNYNIVVISIKEIGLDVTRIDGINQFYLSLSRQLKHIRLECTGIPISVEYGALEVNTQAMEYAVAAIDARLYISLDIRNEIANKEGMAEIFLSTIMSNPLLRSVETFTGLNIELNYLRKVVPNMIVVKANAIDNIHSIFKDGNDTEVNEPNVLLGALNKDDKYKEISTSQFNAYVGDVSEIDQREMDLVDVDVINDDFLRFDNDFYLYSGSIVRSCYEQLYVCIKKFIHDGEVLDFEELRRLENIYPVNISNIFPILHAFKKIRMEILNGNSNAVDANKIVDVWRKFVGEYWDGFIAGKY